MCRGAGERGRVQQRGGAASRGRGADRRGEAAPRGRARPGQGDAAARGGPGRQRGPQERRHHRRVQTGTQTSASLALSPLWGLALYLGDRYGNVGFFLSIEGGNSDAMDFCKLL